MTLDYDPDPVAEVRRLSRNARPRSCIWSPCTPVTSCAGSTAASSSGSAALSPRSSSAKQSALRHLQSDRVRAGTLFYHLTSKRCTRQSGCLIRSTAALKGDAQIKSRLMVLDFVLAHLGENLLD